MNILFWNHSCNWIYSLVLVKYTLIPRLEALCFSSLLFLFYRHCLTVRMKFSQQKSWHSKKKLLVLSLSSVNIPGKSRTMAKRKQANRYVTESLTTMDTTNNNLKVSSYLQNPQRVTIFIYFKVYEIAQPPFSFSYTTYKLLQNLCLNKPNFSLEWSSAALCWQLKYLQVGKPNTLGKRQPFKGILCQTSNISLTLTEKLLKQVKALPIHACCTCFALFCNMQL